MNGLHAKKHELAEAIRRHTDVSVERQRQQAIVDGLQRDFISGAIAIEDIEPAQSRLSVLDQALGGLSTLIAQLESDIGLATIDPDRQAKIEMAAEAAIAVGSEYDRMCSLRLEVVEYLREKGEELLKSVHEIRRLQGDYASAVRDLEPLLDSPTTFESPRHIPVYHGLQQELREAGATESALYAAGAMHLARPATEFADVFTILEERAINHRRAQSAGATA